MTASNKSIKTPGYKPLGKAPVMIKYKNIATSNTKKRERTLMRPHLFFGDIPKYTRRKTGSKPQVPLTFTMLII
jgi:hypothetical protein